MPSAAHNPSAAHHSVIILGGGVGGLASAIRLAARGCSVTLVEKNAHLGGGLNYLNVPHPRSETPTATPNGGQCADRPFRFDTGPSLLTLPLVIADLFSAAGDDVRDHLQITRLNPLSQFIWADGSKFALPDSLADVSEAVRRFAPGDIGGVEKLLNHGQKVWDSFADTPDHRRSGPLDRTVGWALPMAAWKMLTVSLRSRVMHKFAALVDRNIHSQRLRDVFYQYAAAIGSHPHHAPASTAVIPFIELEMGSWYVTGGISRIIDALETLARKLGVTILTDCRIADIQIDATDGSSRVTGVTLSGGRSLKAAAVVASADGLDAHSNLMPNRFSPSFPTASLGRLMRGGSGIVLMLGTDGIYPQLAHRTRFMPGDYAAELSSIFCTRTIPDDPCIDVYAPTRTDPALAPHGCENLCIHCSAPPLDGRIDWAIQGPKYRDRIIHKLEHTFGLTDLSKRIVVERRITPADTAAMFDADAGISDSRSGDGVGPAFRNQPESDAHIKGLYFARAPSHLATGPSLGALSGKIVSELVLNDFGLKLDANAGT